MKTTFFDWRELLAIVGLCAIIQTRIENITNEVALSYIVSVVVLGVSAFAIMGTRWARIKENALRIKNIVNGKLGEELKSEILSAKKTIHTTHTYPYVPSPDYTNSLIYSIKSGAVLYRVIDPKICEKKEVSDWLKKFDKFKSMEKYYEYRLLNSESPRTINFTVIDKKTVFIYLSDSMRKGNQDQVIEIKSKEVANCFISAYEKLAKSSSAV